METTTIIAILNSSFIVTVFAFCAPKIYRCCCKICPCFGLDESGTDAVQGTGGKTNPGQSSGVKKNPDPSPGGQTKASPSQGGQTKAGPSRGGQSSGELIFSAGELEIEHIDDKESWEWVDFPNEPRFKKAAQLRYNTWVEISGRIKFSRLSPNTKYDAYFIFKTRDDSQGLHLIQDAYIIVGKKYLSSNKVCLKPTFDTPGDTPYLSPVESSDEWMELNLGQFNSDAVTSYKEVVIKIKEINDFKQKTGLIVAGMELRPIKPKSMGQS